MTEQTNDAIVGVAVPNNPKARRHDVVQTLLSASSVSVEKPDTETFTQALVLGRRVGGAVPTVIALTLGDLVDIAQQAGVQIEEPTPDLATVIAVAVAPLQSPTGFRFEGTDEQCRVVAWEAEREEAGCWAIGGMCRVGS